MSRMTTKLFVSCMDDRVQTGAERLVRQKGIEGKHHRISLAGGICDFVEHDNRRRFMEEQLDVFARRGVIVDEIIAGNHLDCGGHPGFVLKSSERSHHRGQMQAGFSCMLRMLDDAYKRQGVDFDPTSVTFSPHLASEETDWEFVPVD